MAISCPRPESGTSRTTVPSARKRRTQKSPPARRAAETNATSLAPAAKARPNGADPTNAIVPSKKDLRSIAIKLIEPHSQPRGHRHLSDDEFAQAVHFVENLTNRRRIVPRRPTRATADSIA